MTELAIFIVDYKFVAILVLVLLALFLFLRLTGYGRSLDDRARLDSMSDRDLGVEADFYISYGDFERAAQVTREALLVEPNSADLGLKLLEIYFASGNRKEFLNYSRYYKAKFGSSNQWNAICTMGQKLLPDELLFR